MPVFGSVSKSHLKLARPELITLCNDVIKRVDFKVLDSIRGKAAQTKAYRTGHSKAQFPNSAHNYKPSVALDLFPAPYDWDNNKAFDDLYHAMMEASKRLGIPIRSGDDWDMNGLRPHDKDNWDAGHYELHPWREWAKKSKPYIE